VNNLLTKLPTPIEIHHAVLAMNKDGAPGSDGFGAVFFQTYWEIVKTDVINAVLEFFTRDWILPNFNVNTIILIPKVPQMHSKRALKKQVEGRFTQDIARRAP